MVVVRDHPRSRGVYTPVAAATSARSGSSPLARGLRVPPCRSTTPHGIIPARAGFTTPPRVACTPAGDHPRSRGVYEQSQLLLAKHTGSSPLARGLLTSSQRSPGPSADHPRSRGVYPATCFSRKGMWGSSPLARGLPFVMFGGPVAARIIPARAGFTRCGRRWPAVRPDHPRSRGVYR